MSTIKTFQKIKAAVAKAPAIRDSARSPRPVARTLASTNPCELMIECVRRTSRNIKHWSSGEMGLRWTAAGMLEATAVALEGILEDPRARGLLCVTVSELLVR